MAWFWVGAVTKWLQSSRHPISQTASDLIAIERRLSRSGHSDFLTLEKGDAGGVKGEGMPAKFCR